MSAARKLSVRKRNQGGYALLMVIFLVTALLITTMAVAPSVLTEGRREKEKEMIWRGKQYTRAVKLYYRKLGRFPTSLDDLTKPKLGSIRFMRQAYKDPMNTKDDGAWRLIYVGPAGQLIGSLKPQPQNLQINQASNSFNSIQSPFGQGSNNCSGFGSSSSSSGFGTSSGVGSSSGPGSPSGFGSSVLTGGASNVGTTPNGCQATGQNSGQATAQNSGQTATGQTSGQTPGSNTPSTTGTPVSADQTSDGSNPIPTGDTPTIVGGNIIGVGSKINKSSIIVYDKARNYRLFEFIWDPSKDLMTMQPGSAPGQLGQPAGQGGIGQQPGQNPTNSPATPQNPANPPQTPNPQSNQ